MPLSDDGFGGMGAALTASDSYTHFVSGYELFDAAVAADPAVKEAAERSTAEQQARAEERKKRLKKTSSDRTGDDDAVPLTMAQRLQTAQVEIDISKLTAKVVADEGGVDHVLAGIDALVAKSGVVASTGATHLTANVAKVALGGVVAGAPVSVLRPFSIDLELTLTSDLIALDARALASAVVITVQQEQLLALVSFAADLLGTIGRARCALAPLPYMHELKAQWSSLTLPKEVHSGAPTNRGLMTRRPLVWGILPLNISPAVQ
eukprot:PhM_4_TR18845/c4_g1_i15/m.100342